MVCERCGTELKAEWGFCEKCGSEVKRMDISKEKGNLIKRIVSNWKENISNNGGKIYQLKEKIIGYCTFFILIIWSHLNIYKVFFDDDFNFMKLSAVNVYKIFEAGSSYVFLSIVSWFFMVLSLFYFTEYKKITKFWWKIVTALSFRMIILCYTYMRVARISSIMREEKIKIPLNVGCLIFLILGIVGYFSCVSFMANNISEAKKKKIIEKALNK